MAELIPPASSGEFLYAQTVGPGPELGYMSQYSDARIGAQL